MRLPIRARLTLSFAGLLVAVLVISGALLLWGFQSLLDRSERAEVKALAEEFATDIALGEPEILADFGGSEPPDSFAQILGRDGGVLETTRDIELPLLSREEVAALSAPRDFSVRVHFGDGGDADPARPAFLHAIATPQGPVVVVGETLEETAGLLSFLRTLLFVAGGVLLIVVSGLAWLVSGAALRPVERMRREVSLISETDLERRLAVPATGDEIASLATTLNDMLKRLAHAFERERRMVDDASHELRTPLAILKTELQLALRGSRTREELEAALASAAVESDRLNRLAENLLVLARLNRGRAPVQRTHVDLTALAERVAARFRATAEGKRVSLRVEAAAEAVAWADELRLEQALGNLIANALDHTPAGGAITISATQDGDDEFAIAVSDTGAGFPPAFIAKAFEPFARADGSRASGDGGAGLGLAIVQGIALAHGGAAMIENRAEGGARVTLRAPRALAPI